MPQKKWNIYNRDNREKIERDKAQRKEEIERERIQKAKTNLKFNLFKMKKKRQSNEEGLANQFTDKQKQTKMEEIAKSKNVKNPEKTFREMTSKNTKLWYKKVSKERIRTLFNNRDAQINESYLSITQRRQDLRKSMKSKLRRIKKTPKTQKRSDAELLAKQARREARALRKKAELRRARNN